MPRQPRIDFPGAVHHVMSRGARRAPIFKADDHCLLFLDCLDDTVYRHGLEVLAYSLMPNHFHLLVRSPESRPVLSRSLRHLLSSYTVQVNRLHQWDGPLFRGRFKSQSVTQDAYLVYLLAYIHLNPLRAGLVSRLEDEAWTSQRAYLGLDPAPRWLRTDRVWQAVGDSDYLRDLTLALWRKAEPWPEGLDTEGGWIGLGSEESAAPEAKVRPEGLARTRVARVLQRVCEITGAHRKELLLASRGRGANAARRFAVWALMRATSGTARDVGQAVGMSAEQVAAVLSRLRRKKPAPLEAWCRAWEDGAAKV